MNWATFQNKLNRFSHWAWAAHLVVAVLLAVGFTVGIWNDHAYGAWGDDSPGYTFLAGRLLHHEPLVYQDPVVSAGLEFFGDQRDARWLTPTHHDIISPSGWMASIYPIGLSVLMWLAALVWRSDVAFYGVIPVCAGLSVGLTYMLGIMILRGVRGRVVISLVTAVALGSSQLFFEAALSQPMREIPSIVFLLLSGILAIKGYRVYENRSSSKGNQWTWIWWVLLGLAFGMATNIRETSIMVFPALIPFFIPRHRQPRFKGLLKAVWRPVVLFVVGFLVIYSMSIWNSIVISEHKVKFKKKDITSVAITSNIDHIQSLSLNNLFNNQGKFEAGAGSLPHYWEVMQHTTPVIFLFPLGFLGLWSMWKLDKRRGLFLLLWPLGTLTIFSLWINPYARYLLPAFPLLILLSFIGVGYVITTLIPKVLQARWARWAMSALCVAAVVVPFGYTLQQEITDLRAQDVLIYKSISYTDLHQLKQLAPQLVGSQPVVIFTGDWQYGISETFELHTQIKSIRLPIENKRFDIPEQQVAEFLHQLENQGYTLYVWTDETTSVNAQDFLSSEFERTPVQTISATYAKQISIERLEEK